MCDKIGIGKDHTIYVLLYIYAYNLCIVFTAVFCMLTQYYESFISLHIHTYIYIYQYMHSRPSLCGPTCKRRPRRRTKAIDASYTLHAH